MQINLRHGLMPSRPYLLGDGIASVDAAEAAEAAARAGTAQALIASASASSGYAAAQAAKQAYEQALAANKTQAEAAEAARIVSEQKRIEHDRYMEQKRLEILQASANEQAEANAYWRAVKSSQMPMPAAKNSFVMPIALAVGAYLLLKG